MRHCTMKRDLAITYEEQMNQDKDIRIILHEHRIRWWTMAMARTSDEDRFAKDLGLGLGR